jgi:hypothetical protein
MSKFSDRELALGHRMHGPHSDKPLHISVWHFKNSQPNFLTKCVVKNCCPKTSQIP